MGGVEDDERPSKLVKVTSGDSGAGIASFREQQGGCSLSDAIASPSTTSQADVGSKGGEVELVRVIGEALHSLGYFKTEALLEEESGIRLHSSVVDLFMRQILEGQWDECVSTLRRIGLIDEELIKSASIAILEQKYFELLAEERVMESLETLRKEITPLCVDNARTKKLSLFLLSPSQNLLDGTKHESRKKLLDELRKLLSPAVMMPEKRLVHLIEQALVLPKGDCGLHNLSKVSLLADHISAQRLQILQEHSNEVWFLQFSHNGKYLASSSRDCLVIIWEVVLDGHVSLRHRLLGHKKPVSYISWSPDDEQLVTCGVDEVVRRWDVASGQCLHIYEKIGRGLVSCAWAPDGKSIFAGVNDKSICMWDIEGRELECWKGPGTTRIADLGIATNQKVLVSVCKENMISLFGWESKCEKFIEEDEIITSFSLSDDGKLLLVSLLNEELHLWNIDGCSRLVAKYKGHKRSRFVVRSCFGGSEHAFIASGSEDSQVYIWHRLSGELILTLGGHSGAVNCVSWNPTNSHMLASASDDRTICIWGLNRKNKKCN